MSHSGCTWIFLGKPLDLPSDSQRQQQQQQQQQLNSGKVRGSTRDHSNPT
jgi:hypothetical protein